MDQRAPLKLHTVLAFDGMSCHIEEVVGQGSNAIVYRGWYWDGLNEGIRHHVLIKELFPYHPQKKIHRAEDGAVIVEPDAEELWETHKRSFEIGNEVHLRLLYDHPELMVMGANLNSFRYNGTLYSVLGYSGGRSLQTELNKQRSSLRRIAMRMIGLLDALEAFHKSGYLHLDISPDNVMLVGQQDQERIFLIDYNSARVIGSRDTSYLSCKTGYSPPEVSTGKLDTVGFASDLYSVAAVFYRCLMDRSLTLAEMLRTKGPDGQDSPLLRDVPQTVSSMVSIILKKGLHTLAKRRYQSIGQMRGAFLELIDRIDCVGVTHWSLWENGRRSVEELIRSNPSLRYLEKEGNLYPLRLERQCCISLEDYLEEMRGAEGKSALILAQGGMGKTTLLLHTAMLQGKRYSPVEPAVFYISLNGYEPADTHYIRSQILMRMRFRKEENTFDSAMHALEQLLGQGIQRKDEQIPTALLLLDGLNEIQGETASLVREINELKKMAGVRILAASRSEMPELELETVMLKPLNLEDIEKALGEKALMIPKSQQMQQLLRTPLILAIYIQASDGGKQLDIHSEAELMKAYMDSLLEKEIRQLPEDSPGRWQIDVALNYVLPVIAVAAKRRNGLLTREQLLKVVAQCWNTLGSRPFRKAYPHWIGHSGDMRADAGNPEEWFGIVIDSLLWKRLGMLTKDDSGGCRIYHQMVAEHLSGYRTPVVKRSGRILGFTALLLCGILLVGYRQHMQRQAAEAEIREAFQYGADGYVEYGMLYDQLRNLTGYAVNGDAESFRLYYERTLAELQTEQKRTESENRDADRVARSSVYDQMRLNWGKEHGVYEHTVLSRLMVYPDERAAFYAQQLPLLKSWAESVTLREKTPEFGDTLLALLDADADLAAEIYHIAVGVHLPAGQGQEIWIENIHDAVALVEELDRHRITGTGEDRGQRLSSLQKKYEDAEGAFENVRSRLNRYIRNLAETMQAETMDLQMQLEQMRESLKADNRILESECIDSMLTRLDARQTVEQDLAEYIANCISE